MQFKNINWDSVMNLNIPRKDINGISLMDGDIVAECSVGDVIWGGEGTIVKRPLGIVVVSHRPESSEHFVAEENDYYNVMQIRTGAVEINENSKAWMKNRSMIDKETGKMYIDLHISRYDGAFYAWDNIEKIYNVDEFVS